MEDGASVKGLMDKGPVRIPKEVMRADGQGIGLWDLVLGFMDEAGLAFEGTDEATVVSDEKRDPR